MGMYHDDWYCRKKEKNVSIVIIKLQSVIIEEIQDWDASLQTSSLYISRCV